MWWCRNCYEVTWAWCGVTWADWSEGEEKRPTSAVQSVPSSTSTSSSSLLTPAQLWSRNLSHLLRTSFVIETPLISQFWKETFKVKLISEAGKIGRKFFILLIFRLLSILDKEIKMLFIFPSNWEGKNFWIWIYRKVWNSICQHPLWQKKCFFPEGENSL